MASFVDGSDNTVKRHPDFRPVSVGTPFRIRDCDRCNRSPVTDDQIARFTVKPDFTPWFIAAMVAETHRVRSEIADDFESFREILSDVFNAAVVCGENFEAYYGMELAE